MALTLLIGSGWLLTWCYEHWRNLSLHWGLSGFIAAMAVAGPTILRFVPVFRTPAFRRIALKVMLLLAGIAVPVLCLLLFFTMYSSSHAVQPIQKFAVVVIPVPKIKDGQND